MFVLLPCYVILLPFFQGQGKSESCTVIIYNNNESLTEQ